MSLFKSGDPVFDRLNKYSTEQLLHIVTSTNGSNSTDVINAARQILSTRGYDNPNMQQSAEKQAGANTIQGMDTSNFQPRPVYSEPPPSSGTDFKPWHVILVILFIVRLIACLARHS
jgi:hypothetical protein